MATFRGKAKVGNKPLGVAADATVCGMRKLAAATTAIAAILKKRIGVLLMWMG